MASSPVLQEGPAKVFSGTFQIYGRNFGKLFLVFLLFIAVLAIPLFFFMPDYVATINEAVQEVDALAMYMMVYMLNALITPIIKMIAMMCVIGVFAAPFAMGLAGKIIFDSKEGKQSIFRETARWTCKNYKKLLSAYAVYYGVFALFAFICFFVITGIMSSSHLIIAAWLYPAIVMLIAGGIAVLLGTVFVPFGVIDEGKEAFGALFHSFRSMYSRSFLKSFLNLLLGTVIAVAFAFVTQLPYFCPFLFKNADSSRFQNLIEFINKLSGNVVYIAIAIVIYSLAGVFLYILAYNTYRNAKYVCAAKSGGYK
jgi:hypothetical protein